MTIALALLALLLVIAGLAGLVLPVLPGPLLIFAGLWLAAWLQDYAVVGVGTVAVLGMMAVLGLLADWLGALLGAKRAGASREALVGATLGAIAGLFLGPAGIIIGPLAGAMAGEWLAHPDLYRAGRVGLATSLGLLLALAVKLALALGMLGLFALAWLL